MVKSALALAVDEYTAASGAGRQDAGARVEILEWVRSAIEGRDPASMLALARAYRDGAHGLPHDFRQMLRWALRAATAHSAEAMRLVSDAYAFGQGVPQDAARALLWLQRAALAGDTAAARRLAERGVLDPGSGAGAAQVFASMRKGAEAGDPALMFNLAEAYRDGIGTEIDHAEFFHWVSRAAERGHVAARFELALAYRDGTGVKPDAREYTRLLVLAADAGDPRALNNLALRYLHGEGVEADARRHAELLARAASAGEPSAMFNLAHAYRDGFGVARNPAQYLAWLTRAVQAGHGHARVELAAHYFRVALAKRRAPGAEQAALDPRFEELASRAAEDGDARAMYLLAMAYRLGAGVAADATRAREWTERAAQAGLAAAMLDLVDRYRDARDSDADARACFTWLERASQTGDVVATRRLALAYHDGQGTERDLDACRRRLEVAAIGGDRAAFVLLGLVGLERAGEILPETLHAALAPFLALQAEAERIKSMLLVREAHEGVAYFTSIGTVGSLLAAGDGECPANRMRLYNAALLKDAGDGRRLFELNDSEGARLLRGFFPEQRSRDWPLTTPWDGREYSVYLASFNLRADYLDLWRAQAASACVVTPLAAFAQDREPLPFALARAVAAKPAVAGNRASAVVPALYRVEYDPAVAAQVLENMQPHLADIQAFKNRLKAGGHIVDALVRIFVGEILYLFKPEAYAGEREARMVAAFDIASDCVRRDATSSPARLYVETEPFLFSVPGSKILIGPTVKDRAAAYLDLRHRLVKSRWAGSTRVSYSTVECR